MDNNFDNNSLESNIDDFNSVYDNSYQVNQGYENYNGGQISPNSNVPNYSQPIHNTQNMQYINNQQVSYKPNKNAPETPEEHRKGNLFSWISVACSVGSKLLGFLCGCVAGLIGKGTALDWSDNPIIQGLGALLYGVTGLAELAGFVLMVYVRVKYPKNVFGKVLMWIYIVGFILYLIAAIVLLIACISCANSCSGMG